MKMTVDSQTIRTTFAAALFASSYVPATGSSETHFATAAIALRTIALLMLASTVAAPLLSTRVKRLLDHSVTALLLVMAWLETFPAGNHRTEIAFFTAAGVISLVLSAVPRREAAGPLGS